MGPRILVVPGLLTLLLLQGGPVTPKELAYPGARRLVESRVLGRELEIEWTCYATGDALDLVIAHYSHDPRLSPGAWRMGADERGFQSTADPELHVAIFLARDLPKHSPCNAELSASERTVVQVSLGTRRDPEQPDASWR